MLLQVLIGYSGEKRCKKWTTQRAVSVVTQWRETYVVTWLSWIRANGDGAWRHEWSMTAFYKLKMHRGIDGMFAFSSGLCSWINKDSRIHSRRPLLSLPGLWKSTRWSGLACKCLHTAELSDVRRSSIQFIKLRCVCPMYEAPHEQVSLYTMLNRFSKACQSLTENQMNFVTNWTIFTPQWRCWNICLK